MQSLQSLIGGQTLTNNRTNNLTDVGLIATANRLPTYVKRCQQTTVRKTAYLSTRYVCVNAAGLTKPRKIEQLRAEIIRYELECVLSVNLT